MGVRRSSVVRIATLAPIVIALASCGGGEGRPPPSTPEIAAPAPTGAEPTSRQAEAPWPLGPAPTPEELGAQLDRLGADPGPIKSNWVPPGKRERYGRAVGLIQASPEAVRDRLLDFRNYKELAGPKFKSVRVVDKQGAATDVYFQLPIMRGIVTLWYVTRFSPARPVSAGEVIEGTFVKGNIEHMHIAFTVRPGPDDGSSVLVCDLVLRPVVPAPQSALDEELRDACGDAIQSLRRTLVAKR